MNALLEKMKKSSTIKRSDILSQSDIPTDKAKEYTQTEVPFMNVALSGEFDGGVRSGLTVLAGPSKHFKTLFALVMASAFQKKYKDGIVLFYDSEFGSPPAYFTSLSLDTSRIFYTPITDIEELKIDIMNQLKELKKTDKVFIVIDSIGNLASKKEIDDAVDGKTVTDMSRAKAMKSLWRMVTPHLTLKDIPVIAINHTYQTMELYSKPVVSGGCIAAGTLVHSADGLKAIEDFMIGDEVVTLDGLRKVTQVWNPETLDDGEPEAFEVVFDDGYKVICSDEHKFLVDGRWIEAKNLTPNMEVSAV
jgi:RecA/RadA recombinase